MSRCLGALLLGAMALWLTGCNTLPDTYEDVSWEIHNEYPRPIMIEFYSQHRNAAWPGGGKAYVLNAGQRAHYPLRCRSTEQICYGAWVRDNDSIYWGTGMDDEFGCSDCCMTCEEGRQLRITLED